MKKKPTAPKPHPKPHTKPPEGKAAPIPKPAPPRHVEKVNHPAKVPNATTPKTPDTTAGKEHSMDLRDTPTIDKQPPPMPVSLPMASMVRLLLTRLNTGPLSDPDVTTLLGEAGATNTLALLVKLKRVHHVIYGTGQRMWHLGR
jgi:hypothetical protein